MWCVGSKIIVWLYWHVLPGSLKLLNPVLETPGISQYVEFKTKSECEANLNGNHISKWFQVFWLKFEEKTLFLLWFASLLYTLYSQSIWDIAFPWVFPLLIESRVLLDGCWSSDVTPALCSHSPAQTSYGFICKCSKLWVALSSSWSMLLILLNTRASDKTTLCDSGWELQPWHLCCRREGVPPFHSGTGTLRVFGGCCSKASQLISLGNVSRILYFPFMSCLDFPASLFSRVCGDTRLMLSSGWLRENSKLWCRHINFLGLVLNSETRGQDPKKDKLGSVFSFWTKYRCQSLTDKFIKCHLIPQN